MEELSKPQTQPRLQDNMLHTVTGGPVRKRGNAFTKVIIGLSMLVVVIILSELGYYFYNKSPKESVNQSSSSNETAINKEWMDWAKNIEDVIETYPDVVDDVEFTVKYSGTVSRVNQINETYDGKLYPYTIDVTNGQDQEVKIWLSDAEAQSAKVIRYLDGKGKNPKLIDISEIKRSDQTNVTVMYDILNQDNFIKFEIEVWE